MDCRHEGCVCTSEVGIERDGSRYCSLYCADAAPETSSAAHAACACGHAGCVSEVAGTAIPEEVSLL
jgi:hypothetical protein